MSTETYTVDPTNILAVLRDIDILGADAPYLLNRLRKAVYWEMAGVSGSDLKALGRDGLIELARDLAAGTLPLEWAESYCAGMAS